MKNLHFVEHHWAGSGLARDTHITHTTVRHLGVWHSPALHAPSATRTELKGPHSTLTCETSPILFPCPISLAFPLAFLPLLS